MVAATWFCMAVGLSLANGRSIGLYEPIPRLQQGGEWKSNAAELFQARPIFQQPFSEVSVKHDWVVEGPALWKIKGGSLLLESVLAKDFSAAYARREFPWIPSKGMEEYFVALEKVGKQRLESEQYQRCLEKNGKFRGGHVVLWNKTKLPENYVIEFEAKFESDMGLFILFFSANPLKGGSLFDASLKPRYGVFSSYTRGDLESYHISTYTPHRGTANVRKNPGGKLIHSRADLASMTPGRVHRYRLIKWGNRFQYYLNDELQVDHADTESPLRGGYAGLRLMAGCRAAFRQFRSWELTGNPFVVSQTSRPLKATIQDLQSICDAAKPGETVLIPEGEHADLKLHIRCKGTADRPIYIKATPKTRLTGKPQIVMNGEWVTLSGLRFVRGSRPDNTDQVERRGNRVGGQLPPLIQINGHHNRLSDCHIDHFDKHHNVWIWVKGAHNRVDHCSLTGKSSHGSILNVDPTPKGAWHRIDHNYFSRPDINSDAASVIRIGNGHISNQPGYICIEHNLFEKCDGENEIISDKCSYNIIRHNTFRDSKGGLSLRQGTNTHVYGNWFINCAFGIAVRHGRHLIEHNQFNLPESSAIILSRGQEKRGQKRLQHVQAHDTIMRRNTFLVGKKPVFVIPASETVKGKVVLPRNIVITRNILISSEAGTLLQGDVPSASSFLDNQHQGFQASEFWGDTGHGMKAEWSDLGALSILPVGSTERHGSLSSMSPPHPSKK